jgi:hypothetical protein
MEIERSSYLTEITISFKSTGFAGGKRKLVFPALGLSRRWTCAMVPPVI